jgi:hypothetical protein
METMGRKLNAPRRHCQEVLPEGTSRSTFRSLHLWYIPGETLKKIAQKTKKKKPGAFPQMLSSYEIAGESLPPAASNYPYLDTCLRDTKRTL